MLTQCITSIGLDYKEVGFYLEGVWLWRISGRSIDNWLLKIRARARQAYLILYIIIQNDFIWFSIYIFINEENSFVFDTLLRRSLVGIFVGIFNLSIIFFNDISTSGGPHLHQHSIYPLIVVVSSLDKPTLYHYNCTITNFLMGHIDGKKLPL